jgi:hypothetical protein
MTQHQANAYPVPRTMKAWVLGNSEEHRQLGRRVIEIAIANQT